MGYISDHDIKAVCLDVDGTLYPRWMMNLFLSLSAFPHLSIGLRYNGVRKAYRREQDKLPPKSLDRAGLLEKQALLFLGGKGSPQQVEKMKKRVDKQFYAAWRRSFKHVKAYPHMVETLRELKKKGLIITVISDFPLEYKLKTLKIDAIVDYAVSSEDTGFLKPSVVPFLYMTELMGVKPENCLYCGDSYDKDVLGSKNAGMHSLLLTKKTDRTSFPEADLLCSDWYDVYKSLLK